MTVAGTMPDAAGSVSLRLLPTTTSNEQRKLCMMGLRRHVRLAYMN